MFLAKLLASLTVNGTRCIKRHLERVVAVALCLGSTSLWIQRVVRSW